MWRVTIRGLATAKLRFALTGMAVVLGTAFVAGALALGDTLDAGFEELLTEVTGSADAQVRPVRGAAAAGPAALAGRGRDGIPPAVLDDVRALDEVAIAAGEIEGTAVLVGDSGEPIGQFGAPMIAYNVYAEPDLDPAELREGRWPDGAGEIAVDAWTAQQQGWGVGERVQIAFDGPVEDAVVVGLFGVGDLDNLAGASVVILDLGTAGDRLGTGGDFTAVYAAAAEGVSERQLVEALAATVDGRYEVRGASEIAAEERAALAGFTQVFGIALLVFAGVSLLVGGFLIFNTFTIVLAQRLRELALLRAVGAGRRALLMSVLGEAGLVGLAGGAAGAVLGLGVARALQSLLGTIGFELPGSGLVLQPRTVVVAIVVGVVITLVAALVPARRAVRVPPVAALREAAMPQPGSRRGVRLALSGLLTAAGVIALASGLFGDRSVAAVGAGSIAVILGSAGLASLVARPLAAVIGWPTARLGGVRGELARANAMRNPRRTAATASALMVGLALVGFVAVFAASLRVSATDAVERTFAADVVLSAATAGGISDAALDAVAALPQVAMVAAPVPAAVEIEGSERTVTVLDPEALLALFDLHVVEGVVEDIRGGGLVVSEAAAGRAGLGAGDQVAVTLPGGRAHLPVVAVVDGTGLDVSWLIDSGTYGGVPEGPVWATYVALSDGIGAAAGLDAVTGALADYPQVTVLDRAGLTEQIAGQVNQLVAVVVALLALSVLIALLGIVNTLALSIVERVRELGLLRAVGMTRAEVRGMVRGEAMIVSLLGALLGAGLGVAFGTAFVSAAGEIGVTRLSIPWAQLVAGLGFAAGAGVLAGVLPARRAARLDLLRALRTG